MARYKCCYYYCCCYYLWQQRWRQHHQLQPLSRHVTVHQNIHSIFHGLFNRYFFILTPIHALFDSVRVLPSCCATLYYLLQAQLFLLPRCVLHREIQSVVTIENRIWPRCIGCCVEGEGISIVIVSGASHFFYIPTKRTYYVKYIYLSPVASYMFRCLLHHLRCKKRIDFE